MICQLSSMHCGASTHPWKETMLDVPARWSQCQYFRILCHAIPKTLNEPSFASRTMWFCMLDPGILDVSDLQTDSANFQHLSKLWDMIPRISGEISVWMSVFTIVTRTILEAEKRRCQSRSIRFTPLVSQILSSQRCAPKDISKARCCFEVL